MIVPTLLLVAMAQASADWADSDFEDTSTVNEGTLAFLENPPARPVHHHVNRLTITDASLASGWVRMDQCHYDIDPVPDAEILYTEGRVRGLRLVRTEQIGHVQVEDHSVQLQDVSHGAVVCIEGETRALERTDSVYELRNGPFMRRFLDGYYPMHVTLDVRYPQDLVLVEHSPDAQPGVRLTQQPGHLTLDTWFEGILNTHIVFRDPS
jgi:hypothetical protein